MKNKKKASSKKAPKGKASIGFSGRKLKVGTGCKPKDPERN